MAAVRGYTFPCFKNKVVVVTGASSGIGEVTAIEFAKDGAKLAITGRNLERLNEVAKKCVAQGIPASNVLALNGDVTDDAFVERFFKETATKLGGVDVLVNNAGGGETSNPGEFDKEKLDKAMKLSVGSVYSTIKFALPYLKKSKGCIVNTTSIVGYLANPSMVEYSLSKTAVSHLATTLAYEMAKDGIRINSVAPGVTRTAIAVGGADVFAALGKKSGFGEVGRPENLAAGIQFLASTAASYVTGTELIVDGGQSKLPFIRPEDMGMPPPPTGPTKTSL